MRKNELVIFRNLLNNPLFSRMSDALENVPEESSGLEETSAAGLREELYACVYLLTQEAAANGFYGNIWHCCLAHLLVNDENSYSMACEIRGAVGGGVYDLMLHDMEIIREYFTMDLGAVRDLLQMPVFDAVLSYEAYDNSSKVYNTRIRDRICELASSLEKAKDARQMASALTGFYQAYGVGRFGLHKAFRVVHNGPADDPNCVEIIPIRNIMHVHLDDLIGYEIAKKKLVDNTEAFVAGRPANNCLLYGEAGTGKSSSIKAIANQYYDMGLRVIEIYRHQFQDLNSVIDQIKNRNYRFIIYMDDLSFEEFETEYKYLKAVIEGGLEKKPENVLIYATSNRRHLIRESFSDRNGVDIGDKHGGDTVQEKLSLAGRFGVSIYFGAPSFDEYQEIVAQLADRYHINMDRDQLRSEATKWQLRRGGLSGRTARQFIDYLRGTVLVQEAGD